MARIGVPKPILDRVISEVDKLIAVSIGTGIGVSQGDTVGRTWEMYVNKKKPFRDPFKPKRGKGDVVYEGTDSQRETLRPADSKFANRYWYYQYYRGRWRRASKRKCAPRSNRRQPR